MPVADCSPEAAALPSLILPPNAPTLEKRRTLLRKVDKPPHGGRPRPGTVTASSSSRVIAQRKEAPPPLPLVHDNRHMPYRTASENPSSPPSSGRTLRPLPSLPSLRFFGDPTSPASISPETLSAGVTRKIRPLPTPPTLQLVILSSPDPSDCTTRSPKSLALDLSSEPLSSPPPSKLQFPTLPLDSSEDPQRSRPRLLVLSPTKSESPPSACSPDAEQYLRRLRLISTRKETASNPPSNAFHDAADDDNDRIPENDLRTVILASTEVKADGKRLSTYYLTDDGASGSTDGPLTEVEELFSRRRGEIRSFISEFRPFSVEEEDDAEDYTDDDSFYEVPEEEAGVVTWEWMVRSEAAVVQPELKVPDQVQVRKVKGNRWVEIDYAKVLGILRAL